MTGEFYRHASLKYATVSGYPAGGRWAPPGAFPVLYLGRPPASVVVEAYRHLVEPVEGMTGDLVGPRRFLTCRVDTPDVVDLRERASREVVGLSDEQLVTEVGDYEDCQRVAATAHQLGRKGVIAPSASGLGDTLALFTGRLSLDQMPVVTESTLWESLPADPRRLRSVGNQATGS